MAGWESAGCEVAAATMQPHRRPLAPPGSYATASSVYGTSSSAIGSWYGYSNLPPRKQVPDPQQALLVALASPRTSGTRSSGTQVREELSGARSLLPAPRPAGPPCDRCDGPHPTASCPHFNGGRDDHDDAIAGLGKGGGKEAPDVAPVILSARVVPQPGDGSCLFHSLSHFIPGSSAQQLRQVATAYIEKNPEAEVAGTALRKWVHWDSQTDPQTYAARLRAPGSWGGALEIAVLAELKHLTIHVYERQSASTYKRIATFGETEHPDTADLLYRGRVHYDALQVA